MAKLKEIKKGDRTGIYIVEKELTELATMQSNWILDRYEKEPQRHWKMDDRHKAFIGLAGQKVFDLILQQYGIPSDRNDPTIDWRKEKDYDFYIPKIGKIEIKTFDYWCLKALIKVFEWHGNDYCVIMQFADRKPTRINIMGWLTKDQVEKLPISKVGQVWDDGRCYTPNADAYITDFNKLNKPYDFIQKIMKASLFYEN